MMSFCLLMCLILILQLVGGNTLSPKNESAINVTEVLTTVNSETNKLTTNAGITPGNKEPQDHQGPCSWWCDELYGIIALTAAGAIILISVILCIVSCCLWKRIKRSKQTEVFSSASDMKNRELELLGPSAVLDSIGTFPVQEDPPSTKDVGFSDIENCNLNSEPPQKETPQDNEDQIADGSAVTFPPPESIPMLP